MAGEKKEIYDVVVAGAGNAAMAAAMAAHRDGASVLVLEKAPRALRGGNTRYSGGLFRVAFEKFEDICAVVGDNDDPGTVDLPIYSPDDFRHDINRLCQGKSDPVLLDTMVENSLSAVQWMADLGVRFQFNRLSALTKDEKGRDRVPHGGPLRTVDDGISLSEDWFRIVDEAGIPVLYETMAVGIVKDDGGRVVGMRVRDAEGERVIDCRAAIIASGGFGSDPAMRAAYLGPNWTNVKVRGTRFNTGEMIREMIRAGAESFGDWAVCHATPIDFDAPAYGDLKLTDKTNRLSYPFSLMVNLEGERFIDEGEDIKILTYAKTGRQILEQRAEIAIQVFDSKVTHLLEPRYETADPIVADTLEALADGIVERYGHLDFDRARFLETVAAFNAAVQDGEFVPDHKDGKPTKGLEPEKTNWAQRIDTPPYYAYSAACGLTFTFGGVKVSTDAEVTDILGRPLPGLFATGEVLGGFFYHNYPAGSGLARGAVFGRIAGENAAKYARRNAP